MAADITMVTYSGYRRYVRSTMTSTLRYTIGSTSTLIILVAPVLPSKLSTFPHPHTHTHSSHTHTHLTHSSHTPHRIAQDIFWRLKERDFILEETVEQLQCQQCNMYVQTTPTNVYKPTPSGSWPIVLWREFVRFAHTRYAM